MKSYKWDKKKVINELIRINKCDPCMVNVRRMNPALYCAASRRFGSWTNALKAAKINFAVVLQKRKKILKGKRKVAIFWKGKENLRIINEFMRFQVTYRQNCSKTINHYISSFRHLFKYLKGRQLPYDIKNIRKVDVDNFFFNLNHGNNSGKNYMYYNLNRFFKFCCFKQYIKHNPIDAFLKPRFSQHSSPRILNDEAISQIINNIENLCYYSPLVKFRNILMFYLFIFCGLRTNEIINLQTDDIDQRKKTVKIINSKCGKSRILPINNIICCYLYKYLQLRKSCSIKTLFLTNFLDGPISKSSMYDGIIRIGKKILNKNTSPRLLRHYFASRLYSKKVDPIVIQNLMGHSDFKTTAKYIYVSPEFLRDEIRKHPLYSLSKYRL